MSKKLTREFIALKAKSDRLQSITKLNLWGSDLDEVSILQQMPLLEVVSLSVNKLSTLKDFADMENLRELYLRNNLISDIREVKYLATCPNLRVLSLNENPIANMKGYRQTILRILPNLTKFDEVLVTEAEKNNTYDNDTEEVDNNNQDDYEQEEEVQPQINKKYIPPKEDDYYGKKAQNQYEPKYSKKISNPKVNQNREYDNNYEEDYGGNYESKYSQSKKNRRNSNEKRRQNDDYDDNDYPQQRQRPQRQAPIYRKKKPNVYEDEEYVDQRNCKRNNRSSNVLNCVLMLINELNLNELECVKDEIDKKIN